MSPRNNHVNSIRTTAKLGFVGLVLVSLLLSTNKAKAEEYVTGSVNADVSLDGVGGSSCGVAFIEGASSGLDDYDVLEIESPPGPWDVYVKALGSVDGFPASGIANPPLPKVTGSSGGASFSCSFVVKEGKIVVLENASYSFSASSSMPSDCRVTVNGVDLSESTSIPGGEISGTFTEGEYSIGDISIDVEYEGNGEEPNNPDPNTPIEPNIPLDAGPHILRIDNVHGKFNSTTFKLVYKLEAKEGIDGYDQEYTNFIGIPPPFIVSQVGDKYLTLDSRNTDSKTPVYLEQALFSDYTGPINTGGDTNALVFSFPEDEGTNNKFGNRILTFQEYIPDANEPNAPASNFPDPNAETYPVYLIRKLIEDGNGLGVVILPDLERRVYAGTWHNFILKTDMPTGELAVGDFDRNGSVDVNDCNALEGAIGHTGNSVYDIASVDPNDPNVLYIGIRPDKKVDDNDRMAIYQLMDSDKKRREDINRREESDELKLTESSARMLTSSYCAGIWFKLSF